MDPKLKTKVDAAVRIAVARERVKFNAERDGVASLIAHLQRRLERAEAERDMSQHEYAVAAAALARKE